MILDRIISEMASNAKIIFSGLGEINVVVFVVAASNVVVATFEIIHNAHAIKKVVNDHPAVMVINGVMIFDVLCTGKIFAIITNFLGVKLKIADNPVRGLTTHSGHVHLIDPHLHQLHKSLTFNKLQLRLRMNVPYI